MSAEKWLARKCNECYSYDANRYLITAAALPIASRVTEASEERPYLGVVLRLDPALVGSVMVEAGYPAPGEKAAVRAFDVSPLDEGLLRIGGLSAPERRLLIVPTSKRSSGGRAMQKGAGAAGSIFTYDGVGDWYPNLEKPTFTPPGRVFAPVWSVLYALMGLSLYLASERRSEEDEDLWRASKALFGIQLVLNVLWSYVFFGRRSPGWALVEISFRSPEGPNRLPST